MIFVEILLLFAAIYYLTLKYYFSWNQKDCKSKVCLVGKTALVTGGSGGIGYEIVLSLASRGCRVIIADCNVDESIKDKIFRETHNPNVILKSVNLASFKSVREFAEDIRKSEDKIDILINNAGLGAVTGITEDGINIVMQVNHYSGFLLTHLLLDLLKKSEAGARIIFTSSYLCHYHYLTMRSLHRSYIEIGNESESYAISKYCQICASDILADKLRPYGITSNCFHPYAVKTNIYNVPVKRLNWLWYLQYLYVYFNAILSGKTAEEGAQTGIYLACANEAKDVTGEFMANLKPDRKPQAARNKEMTEAIWKISEEVVKLKPEERIL